MQLFVKRLKKLNVESLTFDTSCNELDIGGFLDLVANPPRDISAYEDVNTLLIERKADKVYFNTVEFNIRAKGERDYGSEQGGIIDVVEDEEFNLVRFLEKNCNIEEDDPPSVEAEKVTKGLVSFYDDMVGSSAGVDIKAKEAIFEEIMSSISPDAKKFILQDKLKLKQISSIIKSIIMSFSDEEIVEIFISRVRLLGVFDAEDMLMNLTPERLDGILPEIKEKLKMMDVEERYISNLEKKIKAKILNGRKAGGTGEGKGGLETTGGKGEGGIGTGEISSFVNEFSGTPMEEFGEEHISRFFSSVCVLKKEDNNKAGKITEGLENFVKEFVKQFGEDNLLNEAVKVRKTIKRVPNKLRKEIFNRIIKSKAPAKITMVKILLPLMGKESIFLAIVTLVKEGQKEMLQGFLSSLEEEKLSAVRDFTEKRLEKLGVDEEEFSELWKSLTTPLKNLKRSGGVSRRAYDRLQHKLRASMDTSDIKTLLDSFYLSLESDSADVRANALSNIQALLEQLFKGEKITVIRRITDRLTEYAKEEKNKDVYIKYTDTLSMIGHGSKVLGYDFLVSSVVSFFAGEVSNTAKAKVVIPRLAELKTREAINVLLSLLWEEDLREIVVEKVDEFGADSIPYLMDLLKESEDKGVRFALLKIIQSIGEGALEIVKKYLGDKRWYVRRNAVLILGNIGDKEIVDDIYALKDDHEKVQIEIIRTLRHILKDNAESYLIYFLDSNDAEVQKYAISVMSAILSEEGVVALNRRLLLEKFTKEEETEIKKMICDTLAEKGNQQSVKALTQIVDAKKVFGIPEFSEDLRFKAVKAMSEIGGEKAEKFLKTLNRDRSKKIRNFITEKFSKN